MHGTRQQNMYGFCAVALLCQMKTDSRDAKECAFIDRQAYPT